MKPSNKVPVACITIKKFRMSLNVSMVCRYGLLLMYQVHALAATAAARTHLTKPSLLCG
jgi:hypothetical protein